MTNEFELNDEQLAAVTGGKSFDPYESQCNST